MFNKARLKLTLWYLAIIMVISVSFSFVIFRVAANEVERFDKLQRVRIERVYPFPQPVIIVDNSLVHETEQRIITTLVLINLTILLISGISGYILSGITLQPIKEMIDEQKRFISDASHEINTPLTSLKTGMEVFLRSKKTNELEARELVKESILEVNKLQSLSTSLLQLARYEKPNNKQLEIINIKEILITSVNSISKIAKNKKIKITLTSENIKLNGNKHTLENLFTILLENAVKYSPGGNGQKIKIDAKKLKREVEIKIIDEGMGINKKDLPFIFDRFYRSDKSRNSNGYGLGLSIAKKIIEAHNGSIVVESQEGKGSIFIVKLPL